MWKPAFINGWICNQCLIAHDDKSHALNCCSNISEFQGYSCGLCFKSYEILEDSEPSRKEAKEKATECCSPETSVKGYMHKMQMLENQGQMLLFPS